MFWTIYTSIWTDDRHTTPVHESNISSLHLLIYQNVQFSVVQKLRIPRRFFFIAIIIADERNRTTCFVECTVEVKPRFSPLQFKCIPMSYGLTSSTKILNERNQICRSCPVSKILNPSRFCKDTK